MTLIKRLSVAVGLGAALALAAAGPAAANTSFPDDAKGHRFDKGDFMLISGEDQYCNVQGRLVIIHNSCNGNGNKDSNGNGDVED